jgi:hypothetical protein
MKWVVSSKEGVSMEKKERHAESAKSIALSVKRRKKRSALHT